MNAMPFRWVSAVTPLVCLFLCAPAMAQDAAATDDNRDLFANFMHHAVVGKFDRANAYAEQLLANDPDPLAVLGYADEHTNSVKTLILLVNNSEISDSAKKIHELVLQGELAVRQDPDRIKLNIDKLGGDPLSEFNAISRLKESGEYAVPWLLDALADPGRAKLHNRIIRMLPKMGKDAVAPMCISLAMDNNEIKQFVIKALGDIGYPQAAPYLLRVQADANTSPELSATADEALNSMGYSGLHDASQAFQDLGMQYYENQGSVMADARQAQANVWYWNGQRLDRVPVPTAIHNEIMAMRSCEASIALAPNNEDAIALWLAANFQREADLGMNVESIETDPLAAEDATKDENFPRSGYFARSAGATYCNRALELAIDNGQPAVALGAIEALRRIAGESTLVDTSDIRSPLVRALTFPDVAVRVKASLALSSTLPTSYFAGAQNVVPTLSEGLNLSGGDNIVVIDPDEQNLNRVLDAVRAEGANARGETGILEGLSMARAQFPVVSAFFLATDVPPDLVMSLDTIRSDNRYGRTPIILLNREGASERVKILEERSSVTSVDAGAAPADLVTAWQDISIEVGQVMLSRDEALALALDCTNMLQTLAQSQSTVLDFRRAEAALIDAVRGGAESLQISAAAVLGRIPSADAQQAISNVALDPNGSETLRVAAFGSLAESAKISGNLLRGAEADALIDLTLNEPNLTLRTAASQALGALDLPGNKASRVIMTHQKG